VPENQPIWNRPAEQPPPGPGGPSWQPPPGGPGQPPQPPQPPQRKRRKWPWITGGILAGLVVLFVVVGVLASGTGTRHANSSASSAAIPTPGTSTLPPAETPPPPQPTGPDVLAVGATMVVTQDGQDAADVTITRVNVTTQPADPEFGEAPQNGYYITAHVTVKIRDDFTEGFDIYSGDFYAKHGTDHFDEGNGNAFEAPGGSKDLGFSNLGAGETASGTLVFDMPAPHGRIAYAPNLNGQALGYWRY
jgi:hypothetical protein